MALDLTCFPNEEAWHAKRLPQSEDPMPYTLYSVSDFAIDDYGRMWILDQGDLSVSAPKLVVLDIADVGEISSGWRNKLLSSLEFDIESQNTFLSGIQVDSEHAFAYVADANTRWCVYASSLEHCPNSDGGSLYTYYLYQSPQLVLSNFADDGGNAKGPFFLALNTDHSQLLFSSYGSNILNGIETSVLLPQIFKTSPTPDATDLGDLRLTSLLEVGHKFMLGGSYSECTLFLFDSSLHPMGFGDGLPADGCKAGLVPVSMCVNDGYLLTLWSSLDALGAVANIEVQPLLSVTYVGEGNVTNKRVVTDQVAVGSSVCFLIFILVCALILGFIPFALSILRQRENEFLQGPALSSDSDLFSTQSRSSDFALSRFNYH